MIVIVQFAIGLLFGVGLVVAGMSNPAKVLNFLDIAAIPSGGWDASLAFVLGGAVIVAFVGYRLVFRRNAPVFAARFFVPTSQVIDGRLLSGAAIFGLGWGLAGLCPGPAFTALATGTPAALLFVFTMLAGMAAARFAAGRTSFLSATQRA